MYLLLIYSIIRTNQHIRNNFIEKNIVYMRNVATACVAFARKVFIDLRLMTLIMCIWLAVVVFIMVEIGIFTNSAFVSCGPRADLTFIHVTIDTYYKYNMLIILIVMHTIITDVISDSLSPHVLNVVQDTRALLIPHKPITYYCITTVWAIYCSISQLFMIFIAFAQLDLLVVRMFSDIVANFFTTSLYLHGKRYSPHNNNDYTQHADNNNNDSNNMLMVDGDNNNNESVTSRMIMTHCDQIQLHHPSDDNNNIIITSHAPSATAS